MKLISSFIAMFSSKKNSADSIQEKRDAYKANIKQKLSGFRVGEKDTSGYKITKIFGGGDDYVVYEIESNSLVDSPKVYIDTLEEDNLVPIENFGKVRVKFTEVKGLLYKVVDKATARAVISHIVINGIRGNVAEANSQFDTLISTINSEYKAQFDNKTRMQVSALVFTIILSCLAGWVYYKKILLDFEHIHNMVYVASAGGLGGFFSLSINLKKLVCEQQVSKWLYVFYGVERIIIAVFAAIIAYFAIKTDLVFSISKKMDNPVIGYVFFCIISGFSENLVPSILANVEKDNVKQ